MVPLKPQRSEDFILADVSVDPLDQGRRQLAGWTVSGCVGAERRPVLDGEQAVRILGSLAAYLGTALRQVADERGLDCAVNTAQGTREGNGGAVPVSSWELVNNDDQRAG